MRLSWLAQGVLLAMLLATAPARADWLPGGNRIGFNQNGALPAGVYWLRLTQAGHVATRKLAILR